MNTDKSSLKTSRTDIVAAAARGMAGACPVIGGLVAETVNQLIPNQKLYRVIEFLKALDQKFAVLKDKIKI